VACYDRYMATKWVEKIKAKLAANPLYDNIPGVGVTCLACLGGTKPKGAKKVPLYAVTNYGNTFSVCCKCHADYSW
jgi:hypothetical protein